MLLISSQYASPIHPVLHPPVVVGIVAVPEVVAWVVVDMVVVQSPPSKWQSVLFDSSLQTPFATNSVWEQSLNRNINIYSDSSRFD